MNLRFNELKRDSNECKDCYFLAVNRLYNCFWCAVFSGGGFWPPSGLKNSTSETTPNHESYVKGFSQKFMSLDHRNRSKGHIRASIKAIVAVATQEHRQSLTEAQKNLDKTGVTKSTPC